MYKQFFERFTQWTNKTTCIPDAEYLTALAEHYERNTYMTEQLTDLLSSILNLIA